MIDVIDIIVLLITGIAGGTLAGMLGIGGGVIYVFIFSLFISTFTATPIQSQELVSLLIANTVFALVFAGIAGSIKQYKSKNFFPKSILWIGIPGVLAAITTSIIISYSGLYSKERFAVLFSVIMLPVIARMLLQDKIKWQQLHGIKPRYFMVTGLIAGTVTALSGLGGGFVIVPVLNGMIGIPIKKTISISLGVIAFVAFFFTLYNLFGIAYPHYAFPYTKGAIIFPMVLPVVGGVMIGAPLGVQISHKLPNKWLRIIFVTFSITVIVKLLIDFL